MNPRCGYEPEQAQAGKIDERENMLIVGGGPGGMEAAVTAAKRGYHVTLLEKSGKLGGNLKIASKADFKYRDEKYIGYFETMLKKLNVDVRMNTEATPEIIRSINPNVLILATGSHAVTPNIPGKDKKPFVSAETALQNIEKIGEKVVVIGGGQVGVETGIWLSMHGKTVTIVEMLPELQVNAAAHVQQHAREIMRVRNIDKMLESKVTEITEEGVVVQNKEGILTTVPADTVIYSVGYRSDNTLYQEFAQSGIEVYNIGDSDKVSHVYNAVHSAYNLANRL